LTIEEALRASGIDAREARLLLAAATGLSEASVLAHPERQLPFPTETSFLNMTRRRAAGEPVAYILGHKEFYGMELAVDPAVLIPRPETELLVELALQLAPRRVLDVGTGSGALALAIAAELPACEVVASDTSAAALAVARANAERLGLGHRVELVEGTLPAEAGEFDLIVANLPYVSEAEWPALEPEVREWEPREALLAGSDGLDAIRCLLSDRVRLGSALAPRTASAVSGTLALEVGVGQAEAVESLLRAAGFGATETRADLAGIERLVIGRAAEAG
jgi:release factor glutamine methyltransferase